jgi:molybdate transport system substrate-binding protein
MKLKLLFILLFSTYSMAGTIQIAVAANVSYAIDNLIKEFNEMHPDTKVQVVLGSSGKLTAQIKNAAPYQLFMSANMKYPEALYEEKIAVTKPLVYAEGTLAYFSVKRHDFSRGLDMVKDSSIKRIAVANPKTAPYGIATKEAMIRAKVYDAVKEKFIFGESISQTVSYAVTAADLGFIAKSSLYSRQMKKYKENVNWKEVDPVLYTSIKQGIVILKRGESNSEVKAFYDFMLSAEAKQILKNFGYNIP